MVWCPDIIGNGKLESLLTEPCLYISVVKKYRIIKKLFTENDKTVRRTDGTIIYHSGQSLANSFSSMVVQENHHSQMAGNNSFANFINNQQDR